MGVFPLQEVGDNMYKQYCIYSCLAQYMGNLTTTYYANTI